MSTTLPIHRAARSGDSACLAKLVEEDPENVHCLDGTGWTALHCASHRESIYIEIRAHLDLLVT